MNNTTSEDAGVPKELLIMFLQARYEIEPEEVRQLTAEPQVVDLISIFFSHKLHLSEFHDMDHGLNGIAPVALFPEVQPDSEHLVAAAQQTLKALDSYTGEVLGRQPECRDLDDVSEKIEEFHSNRDERL